MTLVYISIAQMNHEVANVPFLQRKKSETGVLYLANETALHKIKCEVNSKALHLFWI